MSQPKPVSRPKVPWGGPDGVQKGPVSDGEAIKRVAVAVLLLTNPTAAVCTAAAGVVLTRKPVLHRVSGWLIALAGLVLFVVLTIAGAGRAYVAPWRELIAHGRETIRAAVDDGNAVVVPLQLWELVRERWFEWAVGQLPIAVAVALICAGAWVAWRRQRYRATWRDDEAEQQQAWKPPSRRRLAKAHRRVDEPKKPPTITAQTPFSELVMWIGATPKGEPAPLRGSQMLSHMVTTGPSGYGKTTTLLRIMQGWLVLWAPKRLPLILFDFKGDPELRRATAAMAAETNRAQHVVSVTGHSTTTYNPLRHGSSEEVASRLIETLANAEGGGFESPHHRSVGERWLILSVIVLDALVKSGEPRDGRKASEPWHRTLSDLVRLMPPTSMKEQAPRLTGEAADRATQLLSELAADKDLARSILGMTQRVALMNETAAGRVMRHDEGDGLDLLDVIRRGDVVVFSLDSQANAAAARAVGNLAVADLSAIMGRLQEERWAKRTERRVMVMLDEFTGLGGGLLQGFLERARGAGGSLVVSTQTDGGFTAVSPEFAESVWGNSNVWLMHRQTGESASSRAEDLGTESGWAETLQVTEDTDALGSTTGGSGVGSLRRVERFRVHPNELKSLEPGQVLFVSFFPRRTERVQITKTRDWAALAPDDEGAQEPETATLQPARAEAAPEPVAAKVAAPTTETDEDFWGDDDAADGRGWTHETDW